MRTLILTGPATEEQLAVSQALRTALAARGGTSLAVGALALLGQHAPLSLTTALEREALHTPRAFAFLTAGGSFLREGKRRQAVYETNARYAENLRTLVAEGEFDAVLCLHRYPAEAVAHLRKTLPFSARCCFVSADDAVVPFLEETALDLYFTAHEDQTTAYERRGISKSRIAPVGIPLPASWFRAEAREDARALLDLPQGIPCYFIQSASDPAAVVSALLARLNGANVRVCAAVPDGAAPRSAFAAQFSGDIRVSAVSSEHPAALYRNACDVLLSVPSGAISSAAVVAGVPLVHLPPRDAFEAQNARFFAPRGMSVCAGSLDEAAALALSLASDAAAREGMLAAQRSGCDPGAAERVVRRLYEG
ncbi:MAG: hypothetical protein GX417_01590 [Clostridiales bacterium]|nr:hypothetical protein [Clostridiales bacterium]